MRSVEGVPFLKSMVSAEGLLIIESATDRPNAYLPYISNFWRSAGRLRRTPLDKFQNFFWYRKLRNRTYHTFIYSHL